MRTTSGYLLRLIFVLAGMLSIPAAGTQESLADRARAARGDTKVAEFVRAESGITLKAPAAWVWQKVHLPDAAWKTDCNKELLGACRVWLRSFPLARGRSDVSEADIRKWRPEFYDAERRTIQSSKAVTVNGRRAYELVWLGLSDLSLRSRNIFIAAPETGRVFQLTLEAYAAETRNYFMRNAGAFQALVDSFTPSAATAHHDFSPLEHKAFYALLGLMMAQDFFKAGNKRYASMKELIGGRTEDPAVKPVLEAFAFSTAEIPGGLRITVTPRKGTEGTFVSEGWRLTYKPPRGGALMDLGDVIEIMRATTTQ